jgi:hypothetical protein
MHSAPRRIRAVSVLFAFCMFSSAAFPQTNRFIHHAADPLSFAKSPAGSAACGSDLTTFAAADFDPPAPGGRRGANSPTSEASSSCDTSPVSVLPVKPCSSARAGQTGCNAPRDLVQEELKTMGKPGQEILRAREKVLDILESENACTAWYREKDPNPAATFRTLSFALDRKGEEYVRESPDSGDMLIFRNPYVARVFQGDGSYATVTINLNGAFLSPGAMVKTGRKEGGPWSFRGVRTLHVGPYAGDTLPAQVIALLHEFGHLLNLLPVDEGDQDGKSVHNTYEVLRYCRAEVESKVKRGALLATR